MKQNQKIVNRRDFLKGVGLAGGTALVSILGDRSIRSVQAQPMENDPRDSIINPVGPGEEVPAAYYALEITGFTSPYFTSCTNMGSENEPIEHKVVDKDGNEITMLLPGRLNYKDIYLERVLDTNIVMWDWLAEVDANAPDYRKNGSILAFDVSYNPIARWDFYAAWPREISSELRPSGADPNLYELVEYSVLSVEQIERVA